MKQRNDFMINSKFTLLFCIEIIFRISLNATEPETTNSIQKELYHKDERILLGSSTNEIMHKIWLLEESKDTNESSFLSKDILNVIAKKIYELYLNDYPILDSSLLYKNEETEKRLKLASMLIDGCINLPKSIFGNNINRLLLTIDPKKFFCFNNNSETLHILIAPKSLIEKEIKTTTFYFESILKEWNEQLAPIGIFYRLESWPQPAFDYNTWINVKKKSTINFYDIWSETTRIFYGLNLQSINTEILNLTLKNLHIQFSNTSI